MLFSSMTFLFVFMPILMTIYFFAKKEIRNYVLLIASILFYSFADLRYLAIMIVTIAINYWGALLLDKFHTDKVRRWTLIIAVILDLSFLFYFKYFNFVIKNINNLIASDFTFVDVIMPIGISFYTFQAMSYLIDVYRKEVEAQKDIYKLALYIVLFPQLVAGPIVKYHDVCNQIDNREERFDKVVLGLKRFIFGLSKKVLIANTLAVVADNIFNQQVSQISWEISWLGIITYALQLYYDFSGYSDMAIGLGMIFGFKFLENFNYPFLCKSISEFWRRWHISLSTWFREYLYIPLGGGRVSPRRKYFNLSIVFLVTGIWHGAEWTFFVWGAWNAIFIVFENIIGWNKDTQDTIGMNILKHSYGVLVFVIGLVMFRSPDLMYSFDYMARMMGISKVDNLPDYDYGMNNKYLLMMIVGVILTMPIFKNILFIPYERKVLRSIVNIWLVLLFVLSTASLAGATYNPFIYFRF